MVVAVTARVVRRGIAVRADIPRLEVVASDPEVAGATQELPKEADSISHPLRPPVRGRPMGLWRAYRFSVH